MFLGKSYIILSFSRALCCIWNVILKKLPQAPTPADRIHLNIAGGMSGHKKRDCLQRGAASLLEIAVKLFFRRNQINYNTAVIKALFRISIVERSQALIFTIPVNLKFKICSAGFCQCLFKDYPDIISPCKR